MYLPPTLQPFCLNQLYPINWLLPSTLFQIAWFRQLPSLVIHPNYSSFTVTLFISLSGRVVTKSRKRHHSSAGERSLPRREPPFSRIVPFPLWASGDKIVKTSPLLCGAKKTVGTGTCCGRKCLISNYYPKVSVDFIAF